jgi:serine/threonine-protein kinase
MLAVMATPLHQAPAEADAELAAGLALQRRTASRSAFFIYVGLALFGLLIHGRASTLPALLFSGLCVVCAGFFGWGAWRRRDPTGWELVLGAAATMVAIGSTFLMDGPMPTLPLFAAVNTAGFATVAGRRGRPIVIAMGVVTVLVPLLGSWFGVLPESFRFVKEGLLLLPMDVDLDPTFITLMYAASFSLGVVLPGLMAGNISDAVRDLSRRSALQAWNLKQMLPAEAAVAPTVEHRAEAVACAITPRPAAAPR